MKVAIVGSRTYTDYTTFNDKLINCMSKYWDDMIGEYFEWFSVISGGAEGADTLAEKWATENNVKITIIRPDYTSGHDPYLAPLLRNSTIAKQCDEMIAFWDGLSRGTLDVITKAVKLRKQVTIFGVNNDKIT